MAIYKNREAKFLNSLKKGVTLSRKQASTRFNLANPSAAILRFVDAGIKINRQYTLRKTDGVRIVKYSIK